MDSESKLRSEQATSHAALDALSVLEREDAIGQGAADRVRELVDRHSSDPDYLAHVLWHEQIEATSVAAGWLLSESVSRATGTPLGVQPTYKEAVAWAAEYDAHNPQSGTSSVTVDLRDVTSRASSFSVHEASFPSAPTTSAAVNVPHARAAAPHQGMSSTRGGNLER